MKKLFATTLLLSAISFDAAASSIEFIDEIVTGAKGPSSIVTMGAPTPCVETACVDPSGGDPLLNTAAAQQRAAMIAMPQRKINFEFARRFPDPAVPIPTSAPAQSSSGSDDALGIPAAPAGSGTIAAQPPVQQMPDSPPPGAVPVEAASASGTEGAEGTEAPRGTIDPSAPPANGIIVVPRDGL